MPDLTRTRTSRHAALLGAGTSLLALAFFAPVLAVYITANDTRPPTALGYVVPAALTGLLCASTLPRQS